MQFLFIAISHKRIDESCPIKKLSIVDIHSNTIKLPPDTSVVPLGSMSRVDTASRCPDMENWHLPTRSSWLVLHKHASMIPRLTTLEIEKFNLVVFMARHNQWHSRVCNNLVDLGAQCAIYAIENQNIITQWIPQGRTCHNSHYCLGEFRSLDQFPNQIRGFPHWYTRQSSCSNRYDKSRVMLVLVSSSLHGKHDPMSNIIHALVHFPLYLVDLRYWHHYMSRCSWVIDHRFAYPITLPCHQQRQMQGGRYCS